jgi:hypothetical protein
MFVSQSFQSVINILLEWEKARKRNFSRELLPSGTHFDLLSRKHPLEVLPSRFHFSFARFA